MKSVVFILFLSITGFELAAQGTLDVKAAVERQEFAPFEKRTYLNKDNVILPFRILYPENYNKSKKYPLVLVLHGAGERGTDNEKQLTHGATLFLKEENRKQFPAIVVFPQCPEESFWSSMTYDKAKQPMPFFFDMRRTPNVPLSSSFELVKKLISEEGADPSRVYITGLSMGGMGTFEMVYLYPDLFAAAMPICGGGDAVHYDSRVLKTSFWVFHGDQDPAVNVKYSREMVDKLKKLKANVTYTEYAGVAHDSWNNAFTESDFLKWMFSHQKK